MPNRCLFCLFLKTEEPQIHVKYRVIFFYVRYLVLFRSYVSQSHLTLKSTLRTPSGVLPFLNFFHSPDLVVQ